MPESNQGAKSGAKFGTYSDLSAKSCAKSGLGAKLGAKSDLGAKFSTHSDQHSDLSAKSQKTSQSKFRGKSIQTELRPAKGKIHCKHCGMIIFSRKLTQHYKSGSHKGKVPQALQQGEVPDNPWKHNWQSVDCRTEV